MKKRLPLALCLLLATSTLMAGISLKNKATTISGFIYDNTTGEALIGANVYLKDTVVGAATNVSGYYVIPQVPTGTYTLVAQYIGYAKTKKIVTLTSDQNIKVNLRLNPDAVRAAAIVITADSIAVGEKLYRKPISKINLAPRQIDRVPQIAEADLLRALQTLPGIKSISDFSTGLYIRGGTPGQNLYLLDGTDVYNPEHAFGLFSTFNTDAIKQVEISKGGYGAEYGGRLSSIIDITNKDGNREFFQNSTSISLLSAKTTFQMPLGKKASLSGSIRRTYFDKTLGPSMKEIPDYYFYDAHIKAFIDIDKNNKLTISAYGGQDVLNLLFNKQVENPLGFDYKWGNRTGSIRWTHIFGPRVFSNFWITASRFNSIFDMSSYQIKETNRITDLTYKGNLEYHHNSWLRTRFGFEYKNLHTHYLQTSNDGDIDMNLKPKHAIAYVAFTLKPTPLLDIDLGIRFNHFDVDTTFQHWAPRLSAKYRLTDKITLKAAAGQYYQYLQKVYRFAFADIWSTSNRFQDASGSTHYILGWQQEIHKGWALEIEAFYKTFDNFYEFNQNVGADIEATSFNDSGAPVYSQTRGVFNRGDGYSSGVEMLLRKDAGRLTGWLGYTWSQTKQTMDGINSDREFAPRHHRTHMLNTVANLELGSGRNRWILGANITMASGQPFTEPGSGYIIGFSPNAPEQYVEYAPTNINNITLPYYGRLDLSITYRRAYNGWVLSPYLQIFNVGNRKNVWFPNYEYSNGRPNVKEQYMLPLLPSFGVKIEF
ncbi:TonB-dependent receptor [bacterium]|nr:TonB-dependent receptor [bacterium]